MLRGSISNFKNPHSIKQIYNINAKIYTAEGVLKISASSMYLKNFKAAQLDVVLSSSSRVVGDKAQELTISVTPATMMTAVGYLVVTIPQYYEGASQDAMIDSTSPQPCKSDIAFIDSCKFSTRLGLLTIAYHFKDNQPRTEKTDFIVGTFKNPIITEMGGFYIE